MLTGTLTLMLMFMLPLKGSGGHVYNRSRWMMVAGTALLPIQFLLQYTLHFRRMGVEPAVLVNMVFFIPAALLLSLSILNLLRLGKQKRYDWYMGGICYAVVLLLLFGANPTGGHNVLDITPRLFYAEVISAVIYSLMQFHYTAMLWKEFKRIRKALDNYYDQERYDVIQWMQNSSLLLSLTGVFAPMVIFWSGTLLFAFTTVIFIGISYTVISFYSYGIDRRHLHKLQEVERSMQEEEAEKEKSRNDNFNEANELADHERQRIGAVVEKWLEKGGHLHSGITIQTVADELHVPRYLFSAWLKTTPQGLFNRWLTQLRIDEAKRQLVTHPEWSNDTIAERCGFSTRNYFQTTFKKFTGMTPAQYLELHG